MNLSKRVRDAAVPAVLYLSLLLLAGCAARDARPTPAAERAAPQALTVAQQRSNLEAFDQVWNTVRDSHFDPDLGGLDWNAIREEFRPVVEQATSMRDVRIAMSEMLGRLGQSHFGIIPSDVLKYMGVADDAADGDGVAGFDVRVVDGRALITSIWEGSPAEKAGLAPGWEIVRIGEQDIPPLIENLSAEFEGKTTLDYILASSVMDRLRGPIDGTVPVRLRDGKGAETDMELPLTARRGDPFRFGVMPEMYVWTDSRRLEDGIGYFTFNQFMHPVKVMSAFHESMNSFMDAPGIILDIRGNTGGMLPMGMGMAGWFVQEEERFLGTLYLRDNELKAIIVPRPLVYDGPVAVLVDGLSASMSEIFSGGLKDLGRARVFGTTTAGAALPSRVEKLPNGDGFQFAMANYISAGGDVLEGIGVIPDEEVPLTREALIQGRDPVLDAAVAWIRSAGN